MTMVAWVDATAGVAGDMLAGAFVDAGVPLAVMQEAVDAVFPGLVRLTATDTQRNGLQAVKFDVELLEPSPPERHLTEIRALLGASQLPAAVRDSALRVFEALGAAEAAAHGIDIAAVHFHEVGAADSIADIVATCAALAWLGVEALQFGEIALGSGSVGTEHGQLPVPTPAALRLSTGLRVTSGGTGELATPTGLALLTTLGQQQQAFPTMRITGAGSGAGSKDFPGRANVVRVLLGEQETPGAVLLETNIDDMDPRLWPGVIASLMAVGAADVWLTPILMKKGRPAHTLSVLCTPERADELSEVVFRETTTIGLRRMPVAKLVLERAFESVELGGCSLRVKIAGRLGRIYNVSIEFDDVVRAAALLGRPQAEILREAQALATAAGWRAGGNFTTD